MNGVIYCHPAGSKLGNASMCWLFAYAHARRVGAEFVCSPWIGEKIFNLPEYGRPTEAMKAFPVRSELDLRDDETNVRLTAYAQNEKATRLYSKEDARGWLRLSKLGMSEVFNDDGKSGVRRGTHASRSVQLDEVVAHWRNGDYRGYSYPICSVMSIGSEAERLFPGKRVSIISEERPTPHGSLPPELSMLPDFYRMVLAPILMRGNSSFSWLAGLLNGVGRVYSPVITPDMIGGIEHDCTYVEGNWPRLTWLEGCGDLRTKGEA